MKKARSFWLVLTASAVFSSGLFAGGRQAAAPEPARVEAPRPEEKINAYFFYEELCGLCHEDIDRFVSIIQEKLPLDGRDKYPHMIYTTNVYEASGRSLYVQVTDDAGLDRGTLQTPLLILGGRAFQGYDSISANIQEAYLTAAEDLYVNRRPYNSQTRKIGLNLFDDYPVKPDHVTLVYFYRITCPECARTGPLIDALPAAVLVNGRERPLDIIRINTRSGNNGERAAAFFDAWKVPDADRMVPIVFFSGSYLAGVEAISANLRQRLSEPPIPWKLLPEKD